MIAMLEELVQVGTLEIFMVARSINRDLQPSK
jgi:hypothetical protein